MKKSNIFVFLLAMIVGMMLIVTACAPAQRPLTDQDMNGNRDRTQAPKMAPQPGTQPNNNNATERLNDAQQKAENIARACDTIPGVEDSTVVISGNTAYVGLDVEGNLEGEEVANVERSVNDRALAADPSIERCVVSSDADTVSRLRNIYEGIRRGTPITTFEDELSDIGTRIAPRTSTER